MCLSFGRRSWPDDHSVSSPGRELREPVARGKSVTKALGGWPPVSVSPHLLSDEFWGSLNFPAAELEEKPQLRKRRRTARRVVALGLGRSRRKGQQQRGQNRDSTGPGWRRDRRGEAGLLC